MLIIRLLLSTEINYDDNAKPYNTKLIKFKYIDYT